MSSFDGLGNVNVELTNRCNKNCWMCGRRKVERDYPDIALNQGDMDFELVKSIGEQLPDNIVVQLHNNGEALLYPRFGEAVKAFPRQITNIVTNGKLIVKKFDEIVDNLDSMAISVFEKDDEQEEQFELIKEFLAKKGERKPYTVLRINGDVENLERYEELGVLLVKRILHSPMGSFGYKKKQPAIPEIGMCWDFLHHLAINREGECSICVRFDPERLGVIGDANKEKLVDIWNSEKRMKWFKAHVAGDRKSVPLCARCEFWGVPTGA
jgi:MoaA/NifB/PqqE/SkfB family radical SAM enzyme